MPSSPSSSCSSTSSSSEDTTTTTTSSSSTEYDSDRDALEYAYEGFRRYLTGLCSQIPGLEKYGSSRSEMERIEGDVKLRRDVLCEGSTWRKGFLAVLNRFSDVEVGRKLGEGDGAVKCYACGRRASFLLFFSGVAYDANALWNDRDGSVTKNVAGKLKSWSTVVPQDGCVPVGPGCKEAAISYHQLHHLKFHFIKKLVSGVEFRPLFDTYRTLIHSIEQKFLEGALIPSPGQELITRWLSRTPTRRSGYQRKTKQASKPFISPMAASLEQRDIRTMLKPRSDSDIIRLQPKKRKLDDGKQLQQGTLGAFFKKRK